MTQGQWGEIRQRLLKTVGQNNFTTWIEPLVPGQVADGVATLHVPTNFFGNYVRQNFSDLLLHEINAEGITVSRLNFSLTEKIETPVNAVPAGSRTQPATLPPSMSIDR